jgi:hypothetical protein
LVRKIDVRSGGSECRTAGSAWEIPKENAVAELCAGIAVVYHLQGTGLNFLRGKDNDRQEDFFLFSLPESE